LICAWLSADDVLIPSTALYVGCSIVAGWRFVFGCVEFLFAMTSRRNLVPGVVSCVCCSDVHSCVSILTVSVEGVVLPRHFLVGSADFGVEFMCVFGSEIP
jgi:hypothetical protein